MYGATLGAKSSTSFTTQTRDEIAHDILSPEFGERTYGKQVQRHTENMNDLLSDQYSRDAIQQRLNQQRKYGPTSIRDQMSMLKNNTR